MSWSCLLYECSYLVGCEVSVVVLVCCCGVADEVVCFFAEIYEFLVEVGVGEVGERVRAVA